MWWTRYEYKLIISIRDWGNMMLANNIDSQRAFTTLMCAADADAGDDTGVYRTHCLPYFLILSIHWIMLCCMYDSHGCYYGIRCRWWRLSTKWDGQWNLLTLLRILSIFDAHIWLIKRLCSTKNFNFLQQQYGFNINVINPHLEQSAVNQTNIPFSNEHKLKSEKERKNVCFYHIRPTEANQTTIGLC